MVTKKPHEVQPHIICLKPDGKGFYTVTLDGEVIYHGRSATAATQVQQGLTKVLLPNEAANHAANQAAKKNAK
jgi:hypothetical protein